MSILQVILLVIAILFASIGIFFIYKRIGQSTTKIDIPKLGKIETESSGILLVLSSLVLLYLIITYTSKVDLVTDTTSENKKENTVIVRKEVEELGEKYCLAVTNKNIAKIIELISTPFRVDDETYPTVEYVYKSFQDQFNQTKNINLDIIDIIKIKDLYSTDLSRKELITKNFGINQDDYVILVQETINDTSINSADTVTYFVKRNNEEYKICGLFTEDNYIGVRPKTSK